jgi:hypothetical protein
VENTESIVQIIHTAMSIASFKSYEFQSIIDILLYFYLSQILGWNLRSQNKFVTSENDFMYLALKVWLCDKQTLRSQCAIAQTLSNWWSIDYQMMRTGYAVTILVLGGQSAALTGFALTSEPRVGSSILLPCISFLTI